MRSEEQQRLRYRQTVFRTAQPDNHQLGRLRRAIKLSEWHYPGFICPMLPSIVCSLKQKPPHWHNQPDS